METRTVHSWDCSVCANQLLPTLIQVPPRNCLSPLTHAQGRGFHGLKRPRCPWAPMLCWSQKILLVRESWMVVPLSVSPPRASSIRPWTSRGMAVTFRLFTCSSQVSRPESPITLPKHLRKEVPFFSLPPSLSPLHSLVLELGQAVGRWQGFSPS